MVKETNGINYSKGYGFCEFVDPQIGIVAVSSLNGMAIGEKTLTVKFANPPVVDTQQSAGSAATILNRGTNLLTLPVELSHATLSNQVPTRVLRLGNMITRGELFDDQELNGESSVLTSQN